MVSSIKPKAIEIQKDFNTKVVIHIKRYCKDVDITQVDFIKACCFKYLDDKWNRDDVQRMLSRFSRLPIGEIKSIVDNHQQHELFDTVGDIAEYMGQCIIQKDLKLKPIKYFTRIDGMNRKERIIGVQEPLHQIFDYVAVEGLLSMLNSKIGVFQCASIPGKGQAYGKRYIKKWIAEKETVYFVKGDIKKCFPSIPKGRLKELLARDVKNETLMWLIYKLLDMFEDGLSIGSYLSQYLCNYYLSYAYHYAGEQLFKIRKTKHKGNIRVRLINHVLFYMDDLLMTGSNKKDLRKAMKTLIKYFADFLGLEVKPKWKVCRISESEPIDMMGFVFRKSRTTIRAKIFIRSRRCFMKAGEVIKQKRPVPLPLAYKCVSAYGWYKNTDSWGVRQRLKIDSIVDKCKRVISYHAKKKRREKDANITQSQTS